MTSFIGLPPVPAELKPVIPFIQRADELKKQDPIISYWCAYYAAQLGIGIKARDTASRDFLFALLETLETMKRAIGPNDAIDVEAASAAYVENFALKVFFNADQEDRSGRATRSTAKKFLASANFLEVLRTFPKAEVSDSVEEKIRYAKWKAADVAKAFREGRRPAAGPPGWEEEQEQLRLLQKEKEDEDRISAALAQQPYIRGGESSSLPSSPPRPHQSWSQNGDGPSETWSTVATPGLSDPPTGVFSDESIVNVPTPRSKPRSDSGSSTGTIGSRPGRGILKPSPDPLQKIEDHSRSKSRSPDSDKKVHFTYTTNIDERPSTSPPKAPPAPPPATYRIYAPAPDPPVLASSAPSLLTPVIIAKAQKHCKFAISSLDYDDAEQAKKELRAALALLGG